MSVFAILGVLLLTLVILIPLLEKFGKPMSDEHTAKISRWIFPLLLVAILAGLLTTFL
ncbi:hypothetical protein GPUN_0601 [Glaciecola punicea ACAM 611]|jgi:hypothetical protein|uniref:Uncharacterized protein n=1 Tax=Glaciecola punicea ACAM 611 TaxID=1121923 RepID=H5T8W8_9ALTE|nr:hypothetical protein [Glaciecola punicea]GAB54745.1 hypothetical protein GPUN_0601 [Glaciecola punicea ACAM 611]